MAQDGRFQDGCHHQVRWEWMSLSQIELVWVRVRVEWECFWVNLREDNRVSESKMAVCESNMAEFKMAAIINLTQNEWVKFFFCQNGWIQDGRIQDGWYHQVQWEWISLSQSQFGVRVFLSAKSESKMAVFRAAIWIQDGSFFLSKWWIQVWWQNSRWLPS